MMKIIKAILSLCMIFTLSACVDSSTLEEKLVDNKYTIQRQEYFIDGIQRGVKLVSSDETFYIEGQFNKDKEIVNVVYSSNQEYYYSGVSEETHELKDDYEQWLKDFNTNEEKLKKYLLSLNTQTRDVLEIQDIVETIELVG